MSCSRNSPNLDGTNYLLQNIGSNRQFYPFLSYLSSSGIVLTYIESYQLNKYALTLGLKVLFQHLEQQLQNNSVTYMI